MRLGRTNSSVDAAQPAISLAFWFTRGRWIPIAICLVVLLASAFAVSPVRDAATQKEITEAYLARPFGYVVLAPLSNVLDTMTLLSVRQHIAVVLGLLALWAASRFAPRQRERGFRSHTISLVTLLLSVVAIYGGAVFLPRPMAYLASDDPSILKIDFHSHTANSKDAHQSFSVEDSRAWHRAGGYDVAYVTDHGTVAGAERGVANNRRAGIEDMVLLQGIEVTWDGEHVGVLDAERVHRGLLTPSLRDLDTARLALASAVRNAEPIVIWNHARSLNKLAAPNGPTTAGVRAIEVSSAGLDVMEPLRARGKISLASGPTTGGVRAIEISNGGPDGMDHIRLKRQQLVALAERYNLALTTGSDNHGWGYTAPNWTLLSLTDWRSLDHDRLAARIEDVIRTGGFGATRAVERVTVDPGTNTAALAFSVVGVFWSMLTTLSIEERLMWWVWTLAIAGAVLLWRRRRVTF